MFVIIAGLFHVDFHNWNLSKSEVPDNAGKGGFLPYGFSGMMSGAATCFYGRRMKVLKSKLIFVFQIDPNNFPY